MPMFSKGIVLAQHKEPAFSRQILRFVHPQTDSLRLDLRGVAVQTKQEAIIEIARLAQIVDERDGKLLYRKLKKSQGRARLVIADAVDDEPYVSSRIAPLLQNSEEVADGLELCCTVAGCDDRMIMVYKMITDLETRIPGSIRKIKVVRVRGGYPADQKRRLGRFGDTPRLTVGVGALIHLARAVYEHKRQSTVFLTVAGNCIATPMNLEVSIGMTVMQVLERCGLHLEPTRVVCGGSMTGVSILDADSTLVTYTTRAILAVRENERDAHYTCIGCGRCEQVCPSGLNPMYIQRFVLNGYYGGLPPFDAHLCIGCGTCSYICPSKLEVSTAVGRAREYALRHFVSPVEEEEEEPAAGTPQAASPKGEAVDLFQWLRSRAKAKPEAEPAPAEQTPGESTPDAASSQPAAPAPESVSSQPPNEPPPDPAGEKTEPNSNPDPNPDLNPQ